MNGYPPPSSHHTSNFAASGATVGVQAEEVHHVSIYQVDADASPQRKFTVGLRYLENGVPSEAEALISQAITADYDSAEVRFHWVLAMLGKRSYRDLSRGERERLDQVATDPLVYPQSDYTAALEAVKELLRHLNRGDGDPDAAEKRILALRPDQRAKIDQHLNLVISGATRDKLWQETREQARAERFGNDRFGRVWAFFHPEPAKARVREPKPPHLVESTRSSAIAATLVFALAAGYLGWLTLSSLDILAIIAMPLAVGAGYAGVRPAFVWRYRVRRISSMDADYFRSSGSDHSRGSGFANQVSRSFEHYFIKYRPNGADYREWLDETDGVRGYLRDEIAEIYREQRMPVGRVNWLIGHLARDVRRQWQHGTLYDYRDRYQVTTSTRVQCVASMAITLAAVVTVVGAAIPAAPFPAVVATALAVAIGPFAALRWEHIFAARRRFTDEREEAARRLSKREDEYQRWKAKLDATRPDENEMETWLHCDKTKLIDDALRHYRLSWRDVISYAIFQGPARGRRRRRVSDGPWRYTRYDLRLFLITKDGVREVISELDFMSAVFKGQERNNFRFEALSSVNVAESRGNSRTMNLTLTNGPTRNINVTDAEETTADAVDDRVNLLRINLDTSGFTHALRLLEGIAAEGKGWIDRDSHVDPLS